MVEHLHKPDDMLDLCNVDGSVMLEGSRNGCPYPFESAQLYEASLVLWAIWSGPVTASPGLGARILVVLEKKWSWPRPVSVLQVDGSALIACISPLSKAAHHLSSSASASACAYAFAWSLPLPQWSSG